MVTINITEITGQKSCIDPQLAISVFNAMLERIKNDEEIALSFKGLIRITTAFLNIAVGKLYDPALGIEYSKIDSLVKVIDADEDDIVKVEDVKKFAKMFYRDRERFERIVEEANR